MLSKVAVHEGERERGIRPQMRSVLAGTWLPFAVLIGFCVIGVLLAAGNDYYRSLLFEVVIICLLAQALNLIAGYGGLFAVGNVLFFGLGAYVVAVGI
ncbi:MAG: hypothetical protein AB7O43_17640, partial [Hyphomicrobiaceae bacterium]